MINLILTKEDNEIQIIITQNMDGHVFLLGIETLNNLLDLKKEIKKINEIVFDKNEFKEYEISIIKDICKKEKVKLKWMVL